MSEYEIDHVEELSVAPPHKFEVQLATRVLRLPPYMFGRINNLLYEKRRAGKDVIDLGMGNPSDPPEACVIDKLAAAAHDPNNHGYSKSNGILNLRREVASKYFKRFGVRLDPDAEVMTCLGSKEGFSHMCLALMGPGDTAIVPAPYFPVHTYAVALASGNVICPGSGGQRKIPLQHCLHLPASVSQAEVADHLLSAQSLVRDRRAARSLWKWSNWRRSTASW